jgi:hypothetical protein
MDKVYELQERFEKFLPERIRDDAEAIEYSLAGVYNDLPKLNEVQELAGHVVIWTVEMFEAYEEGELDEDFQMNWPMLIIKVPLRIINEKDFCKYGEEVKET